MPVIIYDVTYYVITHVERAGGSPGGKAESSLRVQSMTLVSFDIMTAGMKKNKVGIAFGVGWAKVKVVVAKIRKKYVR